MDLSEVLRFEGACEWRRRKSGNRLEKGPTASGHASGFGSS